MSKEVLHGFLGGLVGSVLAFVLLWIIMAATQ
jgi:hypothetical protein